MSVSIEVKTMTTLDSLYGVNVNVVWNDFCNHAEAEIEMIPYIEERMDNDSQRWTPDDSVELPTLVCRCGYSEIQEQDEPDYE